MLNRKRILLVALAVSVAAFACKKESADTQSSGAMAESESGLFAHLPGDAVIVFGGSYARFMEYWKNSPLKDLSAQMAAMGGGDENVLSDYMNCWVEEGLTSNLAGTVEWGGSSITMNMVFDGLAVPTLVKCAEKVKLEIHKDDDGKYFEIRGVPDGMGGKGSVGYYFITDKTLLFSMKMPLAGMATAQPIPPNRADLEKVLARAKAGSAADNKKTQALIAKADRSKAFWFAGSAAGTPAADSVTEGTAWFDTSKTAMKFGFSVTLTDPQMASMAVTKFKEIPDALSMLPPDMQGVAKDFFKSAKLSSSGGTLKGSFVIENELLEKVGPLMKQMGGGF